MLASHGDIEYLIRTTRTEVQITSRGERGETLFAAINEVLRYASFTVSHSAAMVPGPLLDKLAKAYYDVKEAEARRGINQYSSIREQLLHGLDEWSGDSDE